MLTVAPSPSPAKVPLPPVRSMIVKLLPGDGVKPFQADVVSVTFDPMVTLPVAESWS